MATAKQIAANRLNAQKSTGPRTEAGKARCARNARTLGLFVADSVLLQEDSEEFAEILAGVRSEYQPQGAIETKLVEDLALAMFKQRRYNRMETGLPCLNQRGKTRIDATRQLSDVAGLPVFKSILRAQAQASRDFFRLYKILEDIKRRRRDLLQNRPNHPIEINNNREPEGQAASHPCESVCIRGKKFASISVHSRLKSARPRYARSASPMSKRQHPCESVCIRGKKFASISVHSRLKIGAPAVSPAPHLDIL